LINLGPNINTNDGWEAQPCLSADGKELFFTSSRKGSRDNDIYHSERQKDGSWSIAKPFDIINTDGKDKSLFFTKMGKPCILFLLVQNKKRAWWIGYFLH
jgi:WD40-like Beta Propeller Repeat.